MCIMPCMGGGKRVPDKLTSIWERQKQQQEVLFKGQQIDAEMLTKDFVIALIDEAMGVINCVNYKVHRLSRQPFIRGNMLEELVDVFKYVLSIALLYGVTPEEFYAQFMNKSDRVDDRWTAEQLVLQKGTKIIGVDLDGCVADYVTGFQHFVEKQGYSMRSGVSVEFNFAEAYGLDQYTLETLKETFEEIGGFASLPELPKAGEVMRKLHRLDYKIVIVTSRRQWRVRGLFYDTSRWLKEHNIPCDMLLFSRDKPYALQHNIHPAKCLWFIEDHDKYAFELAYDGTPVLLLARDYNGKLQHESITRVQDWDEIYRIITKDIRKLLEE